MAALVPHLRVTELPHKTVLFEAGDTIKTLYFPHNGIVSIVVDLTSGEMVETATIGRDSVVGGSAAVADDIALNRAVVQVKAVASAVDVGIFRSLAQQKPHFTRHSGAPPTVYSGPSTAMRSLPCRSHAGGAALALVAAMR
jgi:CRP-like cAMP-binding protein